MTEPDKRAMQTDLTGASFLSGVANGWWDHVEDSAPDWPTMIFWVAAAKRDKAPDRFYLKLNCKNYPTDSPTGTFWDPETKEQLAGRKWPKGSGQVSAVFNPTWENGVALYHPLDRFPMGSHQTGSNDWRVKYPQHVWKGDRNVTRYLTMVYRLLNSSEYTGA
jgi:hypothetical protein